MSADISHQGPATRGHLRTYLGCAPGAVEDLLAPGIDVISTVNIANLESLSDVVAKITGAVTSQTVPDPVVRAANEVQVVDIARDCAGGEERNRP